VVRAPITPREGARRHECQPSCLRAASPTIRGRCTPGLVAGHYQPLADDIPLRKRPTKPAFCSRFRKRSKTGNSTRFASTS